MGYYAKVVGDTVNEWGARITTVEYSAPRFLLAEINTHGLLAKSAASSRAIPVAKRIEMAQTDPYIPEAFGRNMKGMSAKSTLSEIESYDAEIVWRAAIDDACRAASRLARMEVHKQLANRVLEPYVFVAGVITATEWDNFFALRTGEAAQPEFRKLALLVKEAIEGSKPIESNRHLPYRTGGEDFYSDPWTALEIAAARCARVSYNTFDGKLSTPEADQKLARTLMTDGHMSPFDHPAVSDKADFLDPEWFRWREPQSHGRYWGWIPYRRDVEIMQGVKSRRSSFEAFIRRQCN